LVSGKHTHQGASEELVWFDFVKRCFEKTLFTQFVVRISIFQILEFLCLKCVSSSNKDIWRHSHLLVQELKIGSALILGVSLLLGLFLIIPSIVVSCPFIIVLIVIVCRAFKREVILECFLTICYDVSILWDQGFVDTHSW